MSTIGDLRKSLQGKVDGSKRVNREAEAGRRID